MGEELCSKIKWHFENELKVDQNEVIEKFLELRREEKISKQKTPRISRNSK
jgi:hypothetical protein